MQSLETKKLVKSYNEKKVVNNVNINLKRGEIVGLLGPNGAGKTTTFYMMVGLISPSEGDIYFGDKNITRVPMYKRANLGIGYLSQEPSIFQRLTVEENILAILETLNIPPRVREKRLHQLLNELNIAHLASNKAYTLSGGERRRVEITRALISKPLFILLDEPFSGIDPIAVAECQEIIKELKQKNLGVLLTDHNVRETLSITDRSYIMSDGKILLSGNAQELIENKSARRIYLGEKFTM